MNAGGITRKQAFFFTPSTSTKEISSVGQKKDVKKGSIDRIDQWHQIRDNFTSGQFPSICMGKIMCGEDLFVRK